MMLADDNMGISKRITAGIVYPFVLSPEIAARWMSGSSTQNYDLPNT